MTALDQSFLNRLAEVSGNSVGKTLGMVIRPTFIARPGKTLVVADWSAIEARVLPWLAASRGAEKVLDIFRRNDADPSLPDIYKITAGELLQKPPLEVTKTERQSHGKVPTLSLGFGGGLGALQKMAVNYHVHLDDVVGKAMVDGWRERNPWARDFWGYFKVDRHGNLDGWGGLWGAANMALRDPGTAYEAGRMAYYFDKSYLNGTLFCAGPSGHMMTYPDCKWRDKEVKDKVTGEVSVKSALWFRKSYGWSALWHGKCAENCTQFVAGCIMRETLKQLDPDYTTLPDLMGDEWMPIVAHTHDEVVSEPEDGPDANDAEVILKEVMEDWVPEWRKTLPLVAEITRNWFYTKAEL